MVGHCTVLYSGRAESQLAAGDRIIVVKTDGTLLIHNPAGLKPVNWQPPGCAFTAALKDGHLFLEAQRTKPRETVRIAFQRVELLGFVRLEDQAELALQGTEFDIRDTLRSRPELVEPGFKPWEKERLTERGPMDLYGEDRNGRRVIVEVKRTPAGIAEATQLWRYVEKERSKRGVDVRGILVAPSASERARMLLSEHGLEFKAISIEYLRERAIPLAIPSQPSLARFTQPDHIDRV